MNDTNRPTVPPDNGDEISLREIYEIIRQKRLLIIITTVLFAAIAGAYSFIRPESYSYQACVSIGIIGRDAHGQPIFVDSPLGVIAQLNNAYIPSVLDKFVNKKNKVNFYMKQFKAFNPKDSSIVCIKTNTPKRFGNIVSQIQNASLQRIVSNNAKIVAISKAGEEAKLEQLHENAKTLAISVPNIKADEEAKLEQLHENAKRLSTDMSNNIDQERYVSSELNLLKKKDTVLKNQEDRINKEILKMQPLMKNSVNGINNSSTALTMMIQNNQVAQEQKQLFNIEMERSVELPKEQTSLLNQLKSLKRREGELSSQIATNSAQMQSAQTALKLREGDVSSQIADNSAQAQLARTTLKALQTTHVVRPSSPSLEPVGPGKGVFIVLGAFIGFILSIFYALLSNALKSKKE